MKDERKALLLSGPQYINHRRPMSSLAKRRLMHLDPLSVGILSARLKNHDYQTRYQVITPNKEERLQPAIKWADDVFISARHFDTTPAQEIISLANCFGKRTIVGGYGPTFNPNSFEDATVRVYGEAEPILDIMIDDLRSNKEEAEYDTRNLPPFNLTDYVHPDRTIYSLPKVGPRLHPFETQRGCPNACSFCSPTRLQKRSPEGVRTRPIRGIIEEIESMHLNRADHIFFVDLNTMSIPPEKLRELLSYLKSKEINWYTEGTVSQLIDESESAAKLLKLMSPLNGGGGCYEFLYGADDLALEKPKGSKDKKRSAIKKAVNVFRKHGIALNLSVVVGLDHHQYPETFYQIANTVREARPSYTFFHIATPYLGTPWGETVYRDGRVFEEDTTKFNHQQVIAQPELMTVEELEQGYIWLKRQFYRPESIYQTAKEHFNPTAMRQDPVLLGPILTGLPWAMETWLGLQELAARGYIRWPVQKELDHGYQSWQ